MKQKLNRPRWLSASVPIVAAMFIGHGLGGVRQSAVQTFSADDRHIQYMGRIDFSNPKLPRFWSPGVTVKAKFKGSSCTVDLNDQVLWGNSHNYVEVVVDGIAKRYHLSGPTNQIEVASGLSEGSHTLLICKDTESGIGYIEFAGLQCQSLEGVGKKPKHKIEFIGDSITAGAGSDTSELPCGSSAWYDQHNAYLSYGPKTARNVNAEWMLSAVSGIGMIHSCCNMGFTMPEVYDRLANRPESDQYAKSEAWDPKKYQPDVITICLGQNDGTGNAALFRETTIRFVEHLRNVHPKSEIVLLTSPMGDENLTKVMKENLSVNISLKLSEY
jgi:hypothetical protein